MPGRDFIRKILAIHAPDGLSQRFPGANRVRRSVLLAIGPNYQHHADGHDKLNAQALAMGGVSLPLHLVVVPNNRLATTIGHVYLDSVGKHECMYQFIDFATLALWVQVECIF
jgi:hypothetical protein